MPEILIRGMEMPHNCFQCLLSVLNGERLFCKVTKEEVLRAKLAPDCPLVELPPHGDLIDLQAMLSESENGKYVWAYDLTDLPEFTKDLPVVIPAEKGETQ